MTVHRLYYSGELKKNSSHTNDSLSGVGREIYTLTHANSCRILYPKVKYDRNKYYSNCFWRLVVSSMAASDLFLLILMQQKYKIQKIEMEIIWLDKIDS